MFYFCVLIACLLFFPRGQADPRTATRRYKPVIQVTEEIDINDITFTTSTPEFERSSSLKTANYYNGIKTEGVGKGGFGRLADTSPSVFPHIIRKDSYGAAVPVEKIYTTGQPLLAPALKYNKPYKVLKVQDGFRPVSYKTKGHEKSKLVPFDPPTTFSGLDGPKQLLTKVVPFSTQLPTKASTREPAFFIHDKKHFVSFFKYLIDGIHKVTYKKEESKDNLMQRIPSPTFSPTVVAQLTSENSQHFPTNTDANHFTTQKLFDWQNLTKKPYHIKKVKKIPENHQPIGLEAEDFTTKSEEVEKNLSSSPEQSESFLSEISTVHKGGRSANNLDGVADSLDLKTGERVEFQMYGMDGPQSYKFGFDTGKGHNRHFRFEERDNTGKVKGHYGYLDEDGKMRIMKYEADPITGFHAGPVEISPDEN